MILRFIYSGIVATCQNERSQHQNKAFALRILQAKVFQKEFEMEENLRLKSRLGGEHTENTWGGQIRSVGNLKKKSIRISSITIFIPLIII